MRWVLISLAKFEGTLNALGAQAASVKSLLITFTREGKPARGYQVINGLLYQDGLPKLVRGFNVFVKFVGNL